MNIKDKEHFALPENPGVYFFLNKNKEIIYIGKAKNIKKRINQYFSGSVNSYKTPKMLEEASSIKTIITNSEKDALILERNLIDEHRPFFNILLLDNKKYPYINISLKKELEIKVKYIYKEEKNSYYFGPFPIGYNYHSIIDHLEYSFLYEKGLPIDRKKISYEKWKEKFEACKKILSSNKNYINFLKTKMMEFSSLELYELANDYKKTIEFFEKNKEKQLVQLGENVNFDVLAFIKNENFFYINIELYRGGMLIDDNNEIIEINISEKETIRQFINQYYKNKLLPKIIISNYDSDYLDLFFSAEIIVPKKGSKKIILDTCLQNAENNMKIIKLKYENNKSRNEKTNSFLKKITNIKELKTFLIVDNSNFHNELPVSVFLFYKNNLKISNKCRKYSIKENDIKKYGNSDLSYLDIGINKYFRKSENEIPDILIVDGGSAHLKVAKNAIDEINIKLPIIGLVKDENHKTNYLINIKNEKIEIEDKDIYNFLSSIQIEVDKFAKNYFRKEKISYSLEGSLVKIKGIGPKIEEMLLKKFGSYSAIYNAELNELEKVVSKNIALKIKEYFKTKKY
ncbi:MAG: GIY-YIG nuclease family protein [Metamycoplasmataceae bacterium]